MDIYEVRVSDGEKLLMHAYLDKSYPHSVLEGLAILIFEHTIQGKTLTVTATKQTITTAK